jgi:hypothetical protein
MSESTPYAPLIRIAGWFAWIQAGSVIFAIAGYFIWPHVFDDHNGLMVLEGIRSQPWEYFMKLDPFVLIGTLLQFPVYLGLWAVLKERFASVSFLALIIGLISTVAVLGTRPIRELYWLSDTYYEATSAEQQIVVIAASESLLAQFHGTAWLISIIFGGLSALMFFSAMRHSSYFQRSSAITLLLSGLGAVFCWLPVIGIALLFLLGTIVGVLASLLVGYDLQRYAKRID